MPTWGKYIVLDLGAESGRVFLVSTDGKRVKIREYLRYQNKPVLINNHLYWDYPKIFDEIKSGIRKAWNEGSSAEPAKPFRRFINTEDASFHNPTDMVEAIDRYLAQKL
ncbi:MAG: hypothetical protein V2A65_09725 [Candidatus Omnitrophota bacterium]